MNDMMKNAVEAIRTQYTQMKPTALEELKALDKKVKRPANTFAYTIGAVSAVVMGAGMSLCMTELGGFLGGTAMFLGIPVGIVGLVLVALAYPVYNRVLQKERERIAPQILQLTEELMK